MSMSEQQARALAREIDRAGLERMLKTIEMYNDAPPPIRIRELTQTLQMAQAALDVADPLRRREYSRLERICTNITSYLLPKARLKAANEFGRPYRWKYEGNFGIGELHTLSLRQCWCETCGGLCETDKTGQGFVVESHDTGTSTAFRSSRTKYNGRTEAIVQHTRQPFERCEAVAAHFNLKVTKLDWSWYGLPTAALFTRRDSK